ncbi:MAG: redox-sensing transcriptional repressor Rex [Clostridiaceae bacterium]|nr:redox-sensing transcriptional repressor Rex [Clostridiaceae bacterium]
MEKSQREYISISKQALKRLPYYLNYLKKLRDSGANKVSSTMIAKEMHLSDVQVRKDLAAVSKTGGRPRTGFDIEELIMCIENYLGYNNINDAVLVGAGHLGRALLSYSGFESYGLRIVAAFDNNKDVVNTNICGKLVFPMEKLNDICRRLKVHIGIITVPADAAQNVCDQLIDSGIIAIWNFAPVHLSVNEEIIVHNENIAASLALLSNQLAVKLNRIQK